MNSIKKFIPTPKLDETPLFSTATDRLQAIHGRLFKGHFGGDQSYGTFGSPAHAPEELPREIDRSIFFLDNPDHGIIDFVLAYKPKKMDPAKRAYQMVFEQKLKSEAGLILEYEGINQSLDGKTCFVKIHAPWEVLAAAAEINQIKMPIQKSDLEKDSGKTGRFTDKLFTKLFCGVNPFSLQKKYEMEPCPTYFTMEFHRSRMEYFLMQDTERFFPQIDRIRLVWDILSRVTVSSEEVHTDRLLKGHKEGQSVDLPYLVQHGVYKATYPVHDSDEVLRDADNKRMKPQSSWPLRPWLYQTWARPTRLLTYQPLDQIRDYLGEKVCMYFAWLGFYTFMLIPLAILGLACFAYGMFTFADDVPMADVCFSNYSTTIICRSCDSTYCHYEELSDYCSYAMVNAVFENYAMFVFAVALSFWAILFMHFWKQQEAKLATKWDTFDFIAEYEAPRPEYQAAAKEKRTNPVTQELEPYISDKNRFWNHLYSYTVVSFLVCIVISVVAAIIIYKMIMEVVFDNLNISLIDEIGTSTFTTVTASIISAICIMILEKIYTKIAWNLTNKEIPRTTSQFETSYTYKMYIFQFVNYYAALFYLAFIQGNMASTPNENTLLTDHCSPVGCTFSVTTQLCVVLIVKQTINNFMELTKPWLKILWRRRKNRKPTPENPHMRFQKDLDLEPLNNLPLLGEYLEMVMQYGFVTMFSAAFPLAPLFALLNNIVEIRIDARKFICFSRRVLPQKASGIGTWGKIIEIVTKMAILTNACLIAFMTDIIDRIVYKCFYSPDGSLDKYMDFSLSLFDTKDWDDPMLIFDEDFGNVTYCKYQGYYNPAGEEGEYNYSRPWYIIMLIKVGFVPLFQNVVLIFQGFLEYLTADVPIDVVLHVQRNRYVFKETAYRKDEIEKNLRKSKDA